MLCVAQEQLPEDPVALKAIIRRQDALFRERGRTLRKNEELYQALLGEKDALLGEKDARMREKDESNMKLLSKTIDELAHANTEIFAIQGTYLSNDSNGSICSFAVCMDLGVLASWDVAHSLCIHGSVLLLS